MRSGESVLRKGAKGLLSQRKPRRCRVGQQLAFYDYAPIIKEIHLLAVELDGKDGLVVTFSDGTTGGYVIEELLLLRPIRERVKIKKTIPNARNGKVQPR